MTAPATVAVVGAGMAGLAAAWRLHEAGLRPVVLERDTRAGGRVRSDLIEGQPVDVGAQFLASFYDRTLGLARAAGLAADIMPVPGGVAVFRAGRLHPVWPPRRLLASRLLSPSGRVAVLRLAWPLLRHWRSLDVHAPHRAAHLDDESVARYGAGRLPDELLDYVVQPSLSSFLYWTPEDTSQAMLFVMLKAALQLRRVVTVRGGLGRLPEALSAHVPVRLGTAVTAVRARATGGYEVTIESAGRGERIDVDGVVCATTATPIPRLFADLDGRRRAFFEAVSYAANTTAAVAVGRRLPGRYYGLVLPGRESERLAIAAVQSARDPAGAPRDRDLLLLYPTGPAARRLLGQRDAAVIGELLADLRGAAPGYDPGDDLLWSRVYRWSEAVPTFGVGHLRRLSDFHGGAVELGCVVFAGDYLGGPSVEGAVTSGLQAADRLLARLSLR